ncbi:MAG: FtsX-like permease family protein [Bacteroidales bacterium]|nr:FtsX-like permease family protein [Bacteroidales bacterium]
MKITWILTQFNYYMPNGIQQATSTPYPLVEGLVSAYPEVENGTRFRHFDGQFSNSDLSFLERKASYVDNSFFNIFTVNFLAGDKENPLNEPYTVVLTKKTAQKYFEDENPIGKNLLYDGKYVLKVTAVIDELPINSDFRFDLFVSMKTMLAINSNRDYSELWMNTNYMTLFLIDKNSDVEKLNEKIAGFLENRGFSVRTALFLSPLSMYHLKPHKEANSFKLLIIFGLIAIFILIIACINFINLSIVNAVNRTKETSIRRIAGSKISSLIIQQLGESVLLSFVSFDLGYLLAERLLPSFNAILGTQIPSKVILNFSFIFSMFLTSLLLGLVSGIFPAIKISRIHALRALTGKRTGLNQIGLGKKGLIVIQYAISVILIISTIIVYQQFDYIKNIDLGFNKEQLIAVYIGEESSESNSKLQNFKDELYGYTGVQNITLCSNMPFYGNSSSTLRKDGAAKEEVLLVNVNVAETSFLETFNIKRITGKKISVSNDSTVIGYCYINQTAANKLAFENPIGERIIMEENKYEIIGVFEDFHVSSLKSKILAQVIFLVDNPRVSNWMVVRCEEHNLNKISELASAALKEYLPDNTYSFFNYGDTDFKAETLKEVDGIEKTLGLFAFIAILIASMGIFGLVALTVKHKTKEIGIRKTLGSTVFEIYKLIAREYIFLAVLGNVVAWLPAWYISNKILQDFAYRIDISLWVFVLGFFSSILLTIITIAFHTIKAARTNPVEALRYE